MSQVEERDLLAERHYGADSEKGWNYQMAASARATLRLDALPGSDWTVQIEGIEDFDIVPVQQGTSEPITQYVQVKTSRDGIDWTTMGRVLTSFVLDAQRNLAATFLLIIDRPLIGKCKQCAGFRFLEDPKDKHTFLNEVAERIRKNFRDQHRDASLVTDDIVGHVLTDLDTDCIGERELTASVVGLVQTRYGLDTRDAQTYVHYIIGRFHQCAQRRLVVHHDILEKWKVEFDLAGQNTAEMVAVQSHLVRFLVWESDEQSIDFKEGRRTRPGHIFDNLDIIRTKWISEIAEAFAKTTCVVVCAPSGQGKSTLALRYVRDNWQDALIVEIVRASTQAEAEAIAEYLSRLQITNADVRVLIDNAGDEVQHWPTVAARCRAMGIPILVTTRTEDWRRLGRPEITGAAIIDPLLDAEEASQLFARLQERGSVVDKKLTAEEAFEKIQGSGLLMMEFVYYLTHGTMLADRLRQQLDAIKAKPNAEKTLSFLLSISLSNVLDCDLDKNSLLGDDIEKRPLASQLLDDLNGEYIIVSGGRVGGLHLVRSRHIIESFHEDGAALATRALKLLHCVPQNEVSRFILHAAECNLIDKQMFLIGLPSEIAGSGPSWLSNALDALHDIGERNLVAMNMPVFQDIVQNAGVQSLDILSMFISPVDGSAMADNLETTMHMKPEAMFWSMKDHAAKIDTSRRGADFCIDLLRHIESSGSIPLDPFDPAGSGRVLWWCARLQFHPKDFAQLVPKFLDSISMQSISLDALADLSTGLFAWDAVLHRQWMDQRITEALRIYAKSTDCTSATLEHDELHIEFLTGLPSSSLSTSDAASRLRYGHAVFPHCSRYCSQGIWIDLMTKGILSHDPTVLAVPVKNIKFEHDVWRNRSQARAIWSYFADETDAKYLLSWTKLRESVLIDCKYIVDSVHMMLQNGIRRFEVLQIAAAHINAEILDAPLVPPERLSDSSSSLLESSPEATWTQTLTSFAACLTDVASGQSARIPALLQTAAQLPEKVRSMQESLESRVLLDSQDLKDLSRRESGIYRTMLPVLRATLTDFPPARVHSPTSYVSQSEERVVKKILDQCNHLAELCSAQGVSVVVPNTVDVNTETVTFPLGIVSASLSVLWTKELPVVIGAIASTGFDGSVWLVPLFFGATINDYGYQVFTSIVQKQFEHGFFQKPMLEIPASLRQTLPVPTGVEPLESATALLCLTATSGLASLREAILGIEAQPKDEIGHKRMNADPYVRAIPALTDCYRESLNQQVERLHTHTGSVLVQQFGLEDVWDYANAVLMVVSEATPTMSYSEFMIGVAYVLAIAKKIPMLSYLFDDGGTPEDQIGR
jgi:hypothetical protein